MAFTCPAIDWVSFFAAMSSQRQQEFEMDLADRDISLGEYMEIVEQAAMEAFVRAASRDSGRFEEDELLGIASAMLSGYVNGKRLLAGHAWESGVAGLYESSSSSPDARNLAAHVRNGIAVSRRMQLRAAVHSRIEAIKGGLITP